MSEGALLSLVSRHPHPVALARIARGPAFPLLARLERAGLVSRRGGLYRLTRRGRAELELQRALRRVTLRALAA